MKRSELNALIADAKRFFADQGFALPPFAYWRAEDWSTKGHECDEIRACGLGWDITDFGSSDFYGCGLLLFTLRNGVAGNPAYGKTYAEKIMLVREGQHTPMHFHWSKSEDIINRGGGELVVKLNRTTPEDDARFLDHPFEVVTDGVRRRVEPGGILRLGVGESITLTPYLYHEFWAEGGRTLLGEVSMVNDDAADNRFHSAVGRFPEIEEDEAPEHLLCTEYPPAGCG